MKSGYVALVGRPNSGKSTLLNNLLGHKVSITSPKPQTTRLPVQAVYEDDRGQIIFVDTPGIFAKALDPVSKLINPLAENVLKSSVDVVVYLIDHTRDRDFEENKILGLVRQVNSNKILAFNKIDIKYPTFIPHYKFLEEEFENILYISALEKTNLKQLLDSIFQLLPSGEKIIDSSTLASPALNSNSKSFVAEIIREKAFIFLRKEIPYTLTTATDEITERKDQVLYIKGRIITSDQRYKKMIIGDKGRMIKEIGMAVRKELETASNRKIYLDLTVEVNPHWYDSFA